MAATVAVSKGRAAIDDTKSHFRVEFSITLASNYGTSSSHGDTLDLSKLGVPSRSIPNRVELYEAPAAGAVATGFTFVYCPGTTQANGRLQILSSQAGGATVAATEYTEAAAYSAALLAAVIKGVAWFESFVN